MGSIADLSHPFVRLRFDSAPTGGRGWRWLRSRSWLLADVVVRWTPPTHGGLAHRITGGPAAGPSTLPPDRASAGETSVTPRASPGFDGTPRQPSTARPYSLRPHA